MLRRFPWLSPGTAKAILVSELSSLYCHIEPGISDRTRSIILMAVSMLTLNTMIWKPSITQRRATQRNAVPYVLPMRRAVSMTTSV